VWFSLSRKNFERMSELWEMSGWEGEPPYFGWLSTALPCGSVARIGIQVLSLPQVLSSDLTVIINEA